jgi:hypothetical protein
MKTTGLVFSAKKFWSPGSVVTPPASLPDTSRFGSNGVFSAPAPTWIQLPSGLWVNRFNGINNYINCGNPAVLNFNMLEAFTLMCWINPTIVNDFSQLSVLIKMEIGIYQWKLGINDVGQVRVDIWNTQVNTANALSTDSCTAGTWAFIAATYNMVDLYAYLNGVAGPNSAYALPIQSTNPPFYVGIDVLNVRRFTGDITLVRILNRTLLPDEIFSVYNNEHDWFGG